MRLILGGIFLFATAACSSSSDGGSPAGSTGGSNGDSTLICGTARPTLIYSTGISLSPPVADEQFLYFIDRIASVSKIPKAGGVAEQVASLARGFGDQLYIDGNDLYGSNVFELYSIDKTDGTVTTLATASSTSRIDGIGMSVAFDDQYLYFADQASSAQGDPLGTVKKMSKASREVTVLAQNQAGPDSFALDGQDLYWVNGGTADSNLDYLENESIVSMAKGGGPPRVLYDNKPSASKIDLGWGELIVTSSDLYFTSINLDDYSASGLYRLPKGGGSPVKGSDCAALSMFVENGALYADCGDRISKFALPSLTETELVCFPQSSKGSTWMGHDADNIYYVKVDRLSSEDGGFLLGMYSIPYN